MGGAAPVAAAAASSRPLFFPAALDVLDGDCNTRKFHHNKILLATWLSFIF
jgi:hypothetical protein